MTTHEAAVLYTETQSAAFSPQPEVPVSYKTREREFEQPSKASSPPPLRRDTVRLKTILLTSSSHKEAGATAEYGISLAGLCVECLSPHGGAAFEILECRPGW